MSVIARLLPEIGEDEKRLGERQCFVSHELTNEDLRDKMASGLGRLGLTPYFADTEVTGDSLLEKVCRRMVVSRGCIVDLSSGRPDVYFELGLAIGLNKPILILLEEGASVSGLLESFEPVLRFSTFVGLEQAVAGVVPGWLERSVEHHLRFNNHCHFVNILCPDRQALPRGPRFLVIDQVRTVDGQGQASVGPHRDVSAALREALGNLRYEQVSLDEVAVGTSFRLCDYCRALRGSQFALCHLAPASKPDVYLLLGLVVGLGLPCLLLVADSGDTGRRTAVPTVLLGLDAFHYPSYVDIRVRLPAAVMGFVERQTTRPLPGRMLAFPELARRFSPDDAEQPAPAPSPSPIEAMLAAQPDLAGVPWKERLRAGDRESFFRMVVEVCQAVSRSGYNQLFIVAGDHLEAVSAHVNPGKRHEPGFSLDSTGLVAEAARTGQAIVAPDVSRDSRYFATEATTRSEVVLPLVFKGGPRVIGVINIESEHLAAFTDEQVRWLERFAAVVANEVDSHLTDGERVAGTDAGPVTAGAPAGATANDPEEARKLAYAREMLGPVHSAGNVPTLEEFMSAVDILVLHRDEEHLRLARQASLPAMLPDARPAAREALREAYKALGMLWEDARGGTGRTSTAERRSQLIFLSAVPEQFRMCREALANDLRAIGCEVRVQEDFRSAPQALIWSLEEYIAQCDRVIALVGDAYGTEAFGVGVPVTDPPRSYTQWEYFLAAGERLDRSRAEPKALNVYFASNRFLTEHPVQQSNEERRRQSGFTQAIKDSGKAWVSFDSVDQLLAAVLRDLAYLADRSPGASSPVYQPLSDPFVGARSIDRTDVVARGDEVVRIVERLESGQSISIVGPRRVGKTSLLGAVMRAIEDRGQVACLYLDLQGIQYESDLWRRIGRWLQSRSGTGEMDLPAELDASSIAPVLARVSERQRTVIMLDEFEMMIEGIRTGAYSRDLLFVLRSLIHSRVCFVTATVSPLYELESRFSMVTMASPFFNVFTPFVLGPVSADDARRLATQNGTLPFSEAELALFEELARRQPYLIQMLGSLLIDSRNANQGQADIEAVRAAFHRQAEPFRSLRGER